MPQSTLANIPIMTAVSARYLNDHLQNGCSLAANLLLVEKLSLIQEPLLGGYFREHQLDNALCEKYVLVGQAINIDLLNSIVQEYLMHVNHVVICTHYLHKRMPGNPHNEMHGTFPQQAFELRLYPKKTQTQDCETSNSRPRALLTSSTLVDIANSYFVDIFKVSLIKLSTPGLLVMDMDSTIIDMECIDEIAKLVGVGEKVSALTERAMQGELDFNQSLEARVSCLQGIALTELEKLKNRLPINPGFAQTIKILQDNGWVTCIASGGFTYFANYLKDTFELSHAISNTLMIDHGCLVGKVEGTIVNGEVKKQVLLDMLERHNINVQQSIAIGDGANDLLMMEAAELGVAYKAKAKVQAAADANIHYCGFEGLLYCLQA